MSYMFVVLKSRLAYGFVWIVFTLSWKSVLPEKKIGQTDWALKARGRNMHYKAIFEIEKENMFGLVDSKGFWR